MPVKQQQRAAVPQADMGTAPAPVPVLGSYRLSDLLVLPGTQQLLRNGEEIPLPKLSFDLLLALIRAAPNTVTLDELMERVWPGLVVSPETVTQRVKLLRDALGDDSRAPRYIGLVAGLERWRLRRGPGHNRDHAGRRYHDRFPAPAGPAAGTDLSLCR